MQNEVKFWLLCFEGVSPHFHHLNSEHELHLLKEETSTLEILLTFLTHSLFFASLGILVSLFVTCQNEACTFLSRYGHDL